MYICLCFISTQDGTTPLLMAANKGHLDIADILIAAGAKVDLAKDVSFKVLKHIATCTLLLSQKTVLCPISAYEYLVRK